MGCLGLGFFVIALLVLIELFGSAFMRQNTIFLSCMIPYFFAAIITKDGKHYVSGDYWDDAPPINFLWTTVSLVLISLETMLRRMSLDSTGRQ